MRCHYMSDLHLETQGFPWQLPKGDILILAGDLCHARCLDPAQTDRYSIDQRARVMPFMDMARLNFAHVLLVAGNHDHYDGVFDETVGILKRELPGVTVLDNDHVEIVGVRFFGTTLWSEFERRSEAAMNGVRRRMGEYFFVKKRTCDAQGRELFKKFRPEDALKAFDASWQALQCCLAEGNGKPTVVITHHAPSRQGINSKFAGNGLDGAYVSDLDEAIATFTDVPVWVHGHTHIRRRYRIGGTAVVANCRGFDEKDVSAKGFSPKIFFDVWRTRWSSVLRSVWMHLRRLALTHLPLEIGRAEPICTRLALLERRRAPGQRRHVWGLDRQR